MSKELISRLYSTEADVRRDAVYRILFDRRHELLHELKQAAFYEQDEQNAVLMAQVGVTLESFPRDTSLERQILDTLARESGISEMQKKMWDYLIRHGSSQMLIAVMGAMGETIPPSAQDFMECCLTHPDPEIRAMSCAIAINSGRPTHFAHVLNLVTDPDPMVAETAFSVVRDLPSNQMNIILDYALGSPDEWVLQNVAPFLPLLINNDLRKVVAKVQYHQHPLVSKKAREALKHLDSIPFVSKKVRENHELETAEAANGGEKKDGDDFASFKEEMEEKRRAHMLEEQKKREENERIEKELAQTTPEELEDLAESLGQFREESSGAPGAEVAPLVAEDEPLIDNLDFENELAVLDEVDDSAGLDAMAATLDAVQLKPDAEVEVDIAITAPDASVGVPGEEQDQVDFEASTDAVMDLAQAHAEIEMPPEPEIMESVTIDSFETIEIEEPSEIETEEVAPVAEASVETPAESVDLDLTEPEPVIIDLEESPTGDIEAELDNIVVEEVSIDFDDEAPEKLAETVLPPPKTPKVPQSPATMAAPTRQVTQAKAAAAQPGKAQAPVPEGAIRIPLIPAAQTIATRYPSFIAAPFTNLFRPARPEAHLKCLQLVADNLIAYLNLCFIQSCLFFASPSEVLARSVKECLKGHLIGPTALRCLHNFALAMKQSRENPVFFTFALANPLTEASDENPVMMLRELKEYLKAPIEPVEESLPQAVEGVAEILRGVKPMLNNLIVMRAPKGAREPFADLSGPLAQSLPADKRPGIDLPHSEAVVLSRDGTEALGLFPYFKYSNRRLFFNRPDPAEFKILLERLEIEL